MTDYKQHIKQFENHLGKKSKLNYRVQIIEIAHASVKKKNPTNPRNSPTETIDHSCKANLRNTICLEAFLKKAII